MHRWMQFEGDEPCGRSETHRQATTLSLFPSWSELGLTAGAILICGYDYTVGDTVHCAIVHDELNLIAPC